MGRSKRAFIAKETLKILENGYFKASTGKSISISKAMKSAKKGTQLFRPKDFEEQVFQKIADYLPTLTYQTTIEVENETTFAAVKRLLEKGYDKVLCLNFASAKHPGGGFLTGAQAQEEALARASGMYPCQLLCKEYYDYHRKRNDCLYSDYMIYSPDVPVIRDDNDTLLDDYFLASIITSPSVNKGCLERNEPGKLSQIEEVMLERIRKVLGIAVSFGYKAIVLGAWGCGVFKNDPADMAGYFHHHLVNGDFKNAFESVVFGVLDKTEEGLFINPFREQFIE